MLHLVHNANTTPPGIIGGSGLSAREESHYHVHADKNKKIRGNIDNLLFLNK